MCCDDFMYNRLRGSQKIGNSLLLLRKSSLEGDFKDGGISELVTERRWWNKREWVGVEGRILEVEL